MRHERARAERQDAGAEGAQDGESEQDEERTGDDAQPE